MNQRIKNYICAVVSFCVLLFFDQYTKILAIKYLKDQAGIVLWKGVFELQYLENRGAAFGMMQNQRYFFLIMTAIVFVIMVYLYLVTPLTGKYIPLRLCMIVLSAGAVGNFIDRLFRRFVVDFFYFSLINFPIFNVADIYVTVTFFVLILLIFFYYKDEDLMIYSRKCRKEQQNEKK